MREVLEGTYGELESGREPTDVQEGNEGVLTSSKSTSLVEKNKTVIGGV